MRLSRCPQGRQRTGHYSVIPRHDRRHRCGCAVKCCSRGTRANASMSATARRSHGFMHASDSAEHSWLCAGATLPGFTIVFGKLHAACDDLLCEHACIHRRITIEHMTSVQVVVCMNRQCHQLVQSERQECQHWVSRQRCVPQLCVAGAGDHGGVLPGGRRLDGHRHARVLGSIMLLQHAVPVVPACKGCLAIPRLLVLQIPQARASRTACDSSTCARRCGRRYVYDGTATLCTCTQVDKATLHSLLQIVALHC